MNTPKRSLLYVIRKRSRTFLLFVILLLVSTLIVSGLSILEASEDSSAELRKSTGASFTMERDLSSATRSSSGNTFIYQQEYITDEMLKEIAEIDGIKSYNAKIEGYLNLKKLDGTDLETIVYNTWNNQDAKYNTGTFGCFDTNYDSSFTSNQFTLSEGRHLTLDDKQVILMSTDLAEKYSLKVGDKLYLAISDNEVEFQKRNGDSDISANSVEVELIGTFNILKEQSDKNTLGQQELYENYVFTDMATFKEVYSTWPEAVKENEEGYESADFFLTDPAKLGSIMSEVSNISSVNWDNFNLISNDEVFQSSAGSMSNVEKLITTMIAAVVVIAAAVITLILSMWVRSRVKEIGILMSTGISKYKIMAQFVMETVLIAVFAFGLSWFTSNWAAGNLAQMIASTIPAGDVSVAPGSFILVCCSGILVILATIGISGIPVMRMKPGEILSKMS